jgi:GTP-binding protein HflX
VSPRTLHHVAARERERAVLVGLSHGPGDRPRVQEHLDELAMLADTAGADVIHQVVQERRAPDPATFIGSGKVDEVAWLVGRNDIRLVIFDDDLSAVQVRNLERSIPCKIVDRSGLILDIFASRARSSESRTQVELAQLQYLLPRLTRQWTHLSKQYGGIGTKGPGETQIETDRRVIRSRITHLSARLDRIGMERTNRRRGREQLPRVALVGYTNAGKSTLMKWFTDADILVEDRLFATIDSTVRLVKLTPAHRILLTDTVGFIRKLPHHLVASFRSTLAEVREADILLHVVDVSHPFAAEHIVVVRETLEDIGAGGKPTVMVFNKVDRLDSRSVIASLRAQHEPAVFVSATRGINMKGLAAAITAQLEGSMVTLTLTLNASHYSLLSRLHDESDILERRYEGEDIIVTLRTTHAEADRLRAELAAPTRKPRPRRRSAKS